MNYLLLRCLMALSGLPLALPLLAQSQAQTPLQKIDSLTKWLAAHPTVDTNRINNMTKLEGFLVVAQPAQAGKWADQIISESRQINYTIGICDGLSTRANSLASQGKPTEAIKIAIQLETLGREHKLPLEQAKAALILAQVYGQSLNNPDKSIRYYLEGERIMNSIPSPHNSTVIGNLIKTYNDLGNLFIAKQQWPKAIAYYQKAMALVRQSEKINARYRLQESAILLNLGDIYRNTKQFNTAETYLHESLQVALKYGVALVLPYIYSVQIQLYTDQNQFDKAEKAIAALVGELKKNPTDQLIKQNLLEFQYKLYAQKKDFEKAFVFLKKHKALSDSLLNQSVVEQVTQLEAKYKMAQKEANIFQLNARVVEDQAKQQVYLIISITLLTLLLAGGLFYVKLQKANRKTEEASQQKDRLFSYISHDLRSPVLSMQAVSQQLSQIQVQPNDQLHFKHWNQLMQKSVATLHLLVENLLQWSLAEQNTLQYRPQTLIVEHEIALTIDLFDSAAQLKEISIETTLNGETPVWADRVALLTILRNLLSNAIKFTPKGGHIAISTQPSDQHVSIAIRDTGAGIAPEHLPTIFADEPEKSQTGTDGEPGNGLGLYLSKQLALLNKGTIRVESELDNGATFIVELPVAENQSV